jgi:hypothetical protein
MTFHLQLAVNGLEIVDPPFRKANRFSRIVVMKKEREVASFWFHLDGPQRVSFEQFVKDNKKLLLKIGSYEYSEWSDAINETQNLLDALIVLNLKYGVPYYFETIKENKLRYVLMGNWEGKWGQLPIKFRSAFLNNPKFSDLDDLDFFIVQGLFREHRKFDSVIEHVQILYESYVYFEEDPF